MTDMTDSIINIDSFDMNMVIQNEYIRKTDEYKDISVYCYTECKEDSPDFLKQTRGVVYDGKQIVAKTFGFTPEYTTDFARGDVERFDITGCRVFDSEEGALLRIFYHDDKWFLATHKKLDAFKSRWGTDESFGELFVKALENELEANPVFKESLGKLETVENPTFDQIISFRKQLLETFYNSLDKNRVYTFLVKNTPDNRIVCSIGLERHKVFFTGSFDKDGSKFSFGGLTMTTPNEVKVQNTDALIEYIDSLDYRVLQGVIVFPPDNKPYKLLNSVYQKFSKVRGNEPSVMSRYIQLRNDPVFCNLLVNLYPEYETQFHDYEIIINKIVSEIHACYIARFIRKEYAVVPSEQYGIIKRCHEWHCLNRQANKVTLSKVLEIFNSQNPSMISIIINHHLKRVNYMK